MSETDEDEIIKTIMKLRDVLDAADVPVDGRMIAHTYVDKNGDLQTEIIKGEDFYKDDPLEV